MSAGRDAVVVGLAALLGAGEARAADEYMYVVNGTGGSMIVWWRTWVACPSTPLIPACASHERGRAGDAAGGASGA